MDVWILGSVLLVYLQGSSGQRAQKEVFCMPDLTGFTFQNSNTERCYQLVYEEKLNWDNARQFCQDNSGRLLNIDNADKQEWLENKLNSSTDNPYKPASGFNVDDQSTWKTENGQAYDPVLWLGARMETDATWRWDQYATSRSGGQMVITWDNWSPDSPSDQDMRYERDVCASMSYLPTLRSVKVPSRGADPDTTYNVTDTRYPWYKRTTCSSDNSPTHPFICEYEGYEYRENKMGDWVYVIIVLASFVSCGFIACASYCLWDKIHTSYNVLHV